MSLNKNTIRKEIADLEKKITEAHVRAKVFVQKKDKTHAIQVLKQKKLYENMLQQKRTILNKILLTEQQQISNALAGDISPEHKEAARRRRTLKNKNGIVSEDARIQGMKNRPCYNSCEKKSWCDPTGWCDTNYYCTPSNREGTTSEPDMKDQKCVPVNKKTKGGRKKKTRKYKKRRKKNNKRKSFRKGGMRRRMSNKMVDEYQNPHNSPKDCCPCVFKLLGMPLDQVIFYQEKFGNGFSADDLVKSMKLGFPEYDHQMWESPDLTTQSVSTNRQLLDTIFSSIPNGMGAVGGIKRIDNTAHCIAFAVTDNNIPIVFDAQVGKVYLSLIHI